MSEKNKKPNFFRNFLEKNVTIVSSIIVILIGMLFALLILVIMDPVRGWKGFGALATAGLGLGGIKNIGDIFYFATPIMCTGVALCLAFKTGAFNIGGAGQYIVGGYAAVYTAVKFESVLHGPWAVIVPIVAAFIAGALWVLIPAVLKAYLNVNVVISTIMFNYIAMYYVVYWVRSFIYDQTKGQSLPVPEQSRLPRWFLTTLFPGSSADIGIIIAIVACVLIWVLLNKTALGYEMKASGMNLDATNYAGIKSRRNVIIALLISGGLCGLGGGLHYLANSGVFIKLVEASASEGFTGIAIACLASNHPLGAIFSALYMAYLTVGGQYMQLYGFQKEIVSVIIGIVIYFSAFVLFLNNFLLGKTGKGLAGRLKKKKTPAEPVKGGETK